MKSETVQDIGALIGLAAAGFGVYDVFGAGWASMAVGLILLSISIYGSCEK
mgnify:CR=1 FL=1